ncbi:MAG: FAD-dependent thymidylate synthase [Clostridia bacterium]|jgi:flavin-dependent thymidylate synthase|nr:FAD-dependent thymidylate synthase [Clostridia bacterium]
MVNNTSKVVIIAYTPEPEKLCASAAGISTTKGTALELYNQKNDLAKAQKLIKNVLKLGHATTIEHACFTIAFENVSAFVEQFMIEFRIASFTVKSRRYVDFSQMGFYQPEFRFQEEVTEERRNYFINLYNTQMEKLFREYEHLVEKEIPREDARFLLPYCYRSNFYCTVNARELQLIINTALKGRGSKYPEIREIGASLLKQAKDIAPGIFEHDVQEFKDNKEEQLRELLAGEAFSSLSKTVFAKRELAENRNNEETGNSKEAFCELLSYTENPESLVASAVLIKHTLCATDTALKVVEENHLLRDKLLTIACQDQRKRELEQVCFTFRINNLTLAGLTHLARHRIQSLNVPSFTEFGFSQNFVIPASIAAKPELLTRYLSIWEEQQRIFSEFVTAGVVKEDLVYLYLSGNMVDVVTTMNGRELFHFFRLRTCNRAQWEIRAIAMEMLDKLKGISPSLFSKFGPSCYVLDKCPEGKLSCGQKEEMKKRFC